MPRNSNQEPKISPKKFADMTRAIFTKGNDFTGVRLAAHMGQKQYQLWTAVNSRGLTPAEARSLADGLDLWVVELIQLARKMRRLATEAEGGTMPEPVSTKEARRLVQPKRKDRDLEPGTLGGAEIIGMDDPELSAGTDEPAESRPESHPDQSADATDLQVTSEVAAPERSDLLIPKTDEPAKRMRFA